ncbi:MAG TPA: hypothetical protein V6D22_04585 [Candidatus Obscuribacterales bacterium]
MSYRSRIDARIDRIVSAEMSQAVQAGADQSTPANVPVIGNTTADYNGGARAEVQMSDGSVAVAALGQAPVAPGGACVVIGGRIFA